MASRRGREGDARAARRRYTCHMLDPALQRHIAACNNIASPAGLIPFRAGAAQVGWVSPDLAQALTFRPRDFHFDSDGVALAARLRSPGARSEALAQALPALAAGGFLRIRGEAFDIRETSTGPVLGVLDRGALPAFGVMSQGVHVNGLVRRADGLHVWVGIRARDKAVAPGKLDNVVAGGIPSGLSPEECLVKEAAEEARLPPDLAATARPAGRVSYVMSNAEGLRRDVLHVFDLDIPEGVVPTPGDDEVERFELWPAARLLEAVRATDSIKFNVNLVLIDLFLREGLVDDPDGSLRAGLDQGPD
jgi:thiamine pyrophosphokinase